MKIDPGGTLDLGLLNLEPGLTGSLHMTLSAEDVRETLMRQPLPAELLEPLWDSASGAAQTSLIPLSPSRVVHLSWRTCDTLAGCQAHFAVP